MIAGGDGPLPRRVVWHSVAPWATSAYGGQTRMVARSLRSAGIEVVLTAAAGSSGGATTWDGFDVLPAPTRVAGSLCVWLDELVEPGRDLAVTFIDAWRLFYEPLAGRPVLSWVPVEFEPLPPPVAHHFENTGNRPIAVAEHGRRMLEAAGLDPRLVPHGIDLSVHRPLVPGDRAASRAEARRQLGVDPDAFVVGIVAANGDPAVNRKRLPESIGAVAALARRHGDVVLLLHTELMGGMSEGLDLRPVLDASGLPRDRVVATPTATYWRGLTDGELAVRYNAMDVLLATSAGEGFCLPLLEAQACGVPVIASSFSGQPDHLGAGWLVGGTRRWVEPLLTHLFEPDPDEVDQRLEEARAGADDLFDAATDFAAGWRHERMVEEHWLPLLRSELARWSTGSDAPSAVEGGSPA